MQRRNQENKTVRVLQKQYLKQIVGTNSPTVKLCADMFILDENAFSNDD